MRVVAPEINQPTNHQLRYENVNFMNLLVILGSVPVIYPYAFYYQAIRIDVLSDILLCLDDKAFFNEVYVGLSNYLYYRS